MFGGAPVVSVTTVLTHILANSLPCIPSPAPPVLWPVLFWQQQPFWQGWGLTVLSNDQTQLSYFLSTTLLTKRERDAAKWDLKSCFPFLLRSDRVLTGDGGRSLGFTEATWVQLWNLHWLRVITKPLCSSRYPQSGFPHLTVWLGAVLGLSMIRSSTSS